MKMVKSLLLGAAAGVVAVAGAQAADLPVKAKPVQYVKICSLYGAGFYYIPGTDTCLKVGGWVRYENGWGYNGSFTTVWFNNNVNNRATNENNWRVKGVISFDAREQTEYGTLRSYATLGVSNNNVGDNATTANYVNRWFIQWAGFTIGHASSFYDFYNTGANQYGSLTGQGPDSTDGGWDVFGYTAQLGNGLSASVAAEVQRRTQILATAANGGVGGAASATFLSVPSNAVGTNYRGHDYPDIVGNIRIDQAWGSAQLQAAWHQVSASYYGATEGTGYPGDKSGFAVGGGFKINTPFITKGDYLEVGADYSEGAMRYLSHGSGVFNMAKFNDGGTVAGPAGGLGVGFLGDAVMGGVNGTTGTMDLTKGWAAEAAFTHFWTPTLKSTIWGNYLSINYGSSGNAMICSSIGNGNGLLGTAAIATAGCDADWQAMAIGLRTEWAATKNLALGLEVIYSKLYSMSTSTGLITMTTADGTKPTGIYTLTDPDNVAVRFRMTRSFYP